MAMQGCLPRKAIGCMLFAAAIISAAQVQAASFVTRTGTHFTYRDAPFYYAGTNCYYLSYFCADVTRRASAEGLLDICRDRGFNVIRIWAFNDGGGNIDGYPNPWAYQQTPTGVYNETALQGLDYAVNQAKIRGLRLILTFTNNWNDYGGMQWYADASPTAYGDHDFFYTDEQCRTWFKARVWTILNRLNTITGLLYKNDPTIFAWELANEPRAMSDSGCGSLLLRTWAGEMSTYIRSLDPNHMVTIGMEGFYNAAAGTPSWLYNGSQGTDFINDHKLANIDFCTVHLYPDHWGTTDTQTTDFLQRHLTDSTTNIKKPVILEEFGRNIANKDVYLQAWTEKVYTEAAAGNASAGWNVWMIEAQDSGHDDGFSLILPDDQQSVNLLTTQAAKINKLTAPAADVNVDHVVNIIDLIAVRNALNKVPGSEAPVRCDVNQDGKINILDLIAVRSKLSTRWP